MSRTYDLDRAHVFHSWSAQAEISPDGRSPARRPRLVGRATARATSTSPASWCSPTSATSTPRSSRRSRSRRPSSCTIAPAVRQRRPLRGGPAHRRAHARRPRAGLLHQRRRRRQRARRSAWPGCTPAGPRCCRVPLVPRRHRDRDQPHRRPAPLGQRLRQPAASCTSSARSSTARSSTPRPRPRSASARCSTSSDVIRTRVRRPIAAIILEPIPGTAGIMVPPPGYLAGVRELCDEHGIMLHRRRGDGRLRPHRAVVRRSTTSTSCRTCITFAKGVNSGYVPLGGVGDQRRDRRDVRAPRLPRRADLLRPPAGLRRRGRHDQRDGARRASSRTPPGSAPRSSAPAWPRSPSGTPRSARSAASACSGPSSWSPTRRPGNRWRPTAAAARR